MHSREANVNEFKPEATVGNYFFSFLVLFHADALLCRSPQDPLQSGVEVHTGHPGGIPPRGAWARRHEGTVPPPVIRFFLQGQLAFL